VFINFVAIAGELAGNAIPHDGVYRQRLKNRYSRTWQTLQGMKVYQGAASYVASIAYRQQRNCLFGRSESHNSGRNITGEIVANQIAIPRIKEVACMLSCTP
jgi:hypothetical protein